MFRFAKSIQSYMKLIHAFRSLAFMPAIMAIGLAHGQEILPCATDLVQQRLIDQNPDLIRQQAEHELGLQAYLQARAGLRDDGDTAVYVIPIVFHVLYDPTAPSDNHNVSNAQIVAQMEKLNNDFRKRNADTVGIVDPFKAIAADTRIEFQLATKDPYGYCTNGIDRITSLRSTQAADFSKLNPWFRDRYVNIWVINALEQNTPGQTTLGYSQLPPFVQDDFGALRDGVIMLASQISPNSTTLTHELGHYLNLMHVWGGDNQPGVACGDDNVEDTPMTKGHFGGCPLHDHTCNSWDFSGAYGFEDVHTGSGTTDPTAPPAGLFLDSLPGLEYTAFTATGVSANPAEDDRFSFSEWPLGSEDGDTAFAQLTGDIDLGKYYEFSVTPGFGQSMTITGMSFKATRSETGPRTFAVRSSTTSSFPSNNTASITGADSMITVVSPNIFFFQADSADEWSGNSVSFTAFQETRSTVTFRIYAWNAEDSDGFFGVDSVQLSGTFGNVDNVQNYMDYSSCPVQMYTAGQGERMRATLNSTVSGRSNLWSEGNHIFTGTAGHEVTCAPEADFYVMNEFACTGVNVQFKDNSKRATPTSWSWTFDGGTPATSTLQNPLVSFSEPGPRSVTLTVSNDVGSTSHTKWDAVFIGADWSEVDGLMEEGFNNITDFQRWTTRNVENNDSHWHWSDQAGHSALGAAKLNASNTYSLIQDIFMPNNFKDKDRLVSPTLAMPFHTGLKLYFRYAYSTQISDTEEITESLRVYASSDCGRTWQTRLTLNGPELVTAGIRSPGYVPAADEWREANFTLPGSLAGDHVRFMFEFTSSLGSNDLYIDDVNITSTNVGIAEHALAGSLGLMPNPATNSLTVEMDLAGAATGTLSFLDMTGRTVHSQTVQGAATQLELDLEGMGLTSGVYLVRLKHGQGQRTERLVVQ